MTERISARSCCHYQRSITTVLLLPPPVRRHPLPLSPRSMPISTKKKQIADGLKQYAISMDTQLSERKKQGGVTMLHTRWAANSNDMQEALQRVFQIRLCRYLAHLFPVTATLQGTDWTYLRLHSRYGTPPSNSSSSQSSLPRVACLLSARPISARCLTQGLQPISSCQSIFLSLWWRCPLLLTSFVLCIITSMNLIQESVLFTRGLSDIFLNSESCNNNFNQVKQLRYRFFHVGPIACRLDRNLSSL